MFLLLNNNHNVKVKTFRSNLNEADREPKKEETMIITYTSEAIDPARYRIACKPITDVIAKMVAVSSDKIISIASIFQRNIVNQIKNIFSSHVRPPNQD